uniref:RYYR-CCHC domain-containing protein n=1 Tax=Onchocerca volvulus TaxID=6282 RepID=A0A2K6W8L9_ONCVO
MSSSRNDTNQGKEKALDEEFGEDSVAVRLIEDYLEGKITSLIDLSQLLKDEAGLVISKSTLARRLKGKVNVKVRRKRGYHQRRAGADELDDDEAYTYSYSLSRNLNETIVTVPIDDENVRQYALVRVAGDGRKRYYRCNQCLKFRRNDKSAPQAYLIMENGRIVGTKHHRHHPDCKPTKRIEATTTSLDRANRKDIRIGLKTPKAAYAEGFYRAIDLASTEGSSSNKLPKIYPSWSRVRKSYFRQNRLGRIDRAKSLSADGSLRHGQRHPDDVNGPVLYTYGEDADGQYVVFESEEIPEGYEPVPVEELEAAAEGVELDDSWTVTAKEENLKSDLHGIWKPHQIESNELERKRLHETVENEQETEELHLLSTPGEGPSMKKARMKNDDAEELRESIETAGESMNENSSLVHEYVLNKPLLDLADYTTKEERRRISQNLIDEIRSSANFKRVKPARSSTSELDEECNSWCYMPCNADGEIMVYSSNKVHLIENLDGEMEIAYDPDMEMSEIVKNLKPYGILSTDYIL